MTAERLVLEPDGLPEVPRKPAPWVLQGSGYVFVMRLPESFIDEHAFVPSSLAGKREGRTAVVLYMDYANAPCGPYRELLLIPARFAFETGTFWSITRIYVSSYDSVVNGRINWGIPKDQADFEVTQESERVERVALSRAGHVFAQLHLQHFGLAMPVHSSLIPAPLRTVMQPWQQKLYGITLRATGKARLAKVLDWRFDPALFPDLSQGEVMAGGYFPSFELTFPEPSVSELAR